MNFENLAYWIRGYFEINGEGPLTEEQSRIISQHVALCFTEEAKNLPPVSEKQLIDARKEEVVCATKPVGRNKGECSSDDLVNQFHKAMREINKKVRTTDCSGFRQPDFNPRKYC